MPGTYTPRRSPPWHRHSPPAPRRARRSGQSGAWRGRTGPSCGRLHTHSQVSIKHQTASSTRRERVPIQGRPGLGFVACPVRTLLKSVLGVNKLLLVVLVLVLILILLLVVAALLGLGLLAALLRLLGRVGGLLGLGLLGRLLLLEGSVSTHSTQSSNSQFPHLSSQSINPFPPGQLLPQLPQPRTCSCSGSAGASASTTLHGVTASTMSVNASQMPILTVFCKELH